MSGLNIKGMPELLRKLGKVKAAPWLREMLRVSALVIENKVARYPPAPVPKHPNRWYERGLGSHYRRKDGGISTYKTSEMLGRMWYATVSGFSAKVGNRAGYAPWVQGRDTQTAQHKQTGWVTLEDVAEQELPELEKRIQHEVDRLLAE